MSELIKHECGVAQVRLKKPLEYFAEKYGTPLYGYYKLFLLMEKQRNRGQDGAGVAAIKFDMPAGEPYMFRERSVKTNALDRIFKDTLKQYEKLQRNGDILPDYVPSIKSKYDFCAEYYMGHLRYGTSGGYSLSVCHPFFRRSSWPTKNLMLAGNFNMTNTKELNESLIAMGQHPIFATDTQALLEKVGYHLDEAHDNLYRYLRDEGHDAREISERILGEIDLVKVFCKASKSWDGGYALIGAIGNGDNFILRDPLGIRPVFYFEDDEVFASASERAPLMTIFNKQIEDIEEVPPGHIIVVKRSGELINEQFKEPNPERKQCSFERIYFSRGNDADIYKERKALGAQLSEQVLKEVGHDLENTVVSFIPNTSEIGYFGFLEKLRVDRRNQVKDAILDAQEKGELSEELLDDLIMKNWPRGEKIAHKDQKLRTFISTENSRNEMATHVYDVTYGIVQKTDNLVCIDDSIVRGTTLRKSILKILSSLNPKKIIIASTAPQIRYPDCYGIDMSELGKFIAFEAAIALLREVGKRDMLLEVYRKCIDCLNSEESCRINYVKEIYAPFTAEQISKKIAEIVYPQDRGWSGEVSVVYQSIEGLRKALPDHRGDWYFTGDYPTQGGYRVVNQAFVNYYKKSTGRSY
ncbi:amidophosphoribosyltransferase [Candidatus Pelagisphaera phototrophica]|uniref:amidophosphoribosyltransferase n=1 Tax=Candidatus Pelagisphaera phototrophica TaxID=2684113 RepID=UPI001A0DDAC2|nr:amidophosphoribosyltransferase [Candidatus Pelagisphaera phototrophica]QXD32901.1 amidophosphoribosyltransferase [Candidatus Pelagisphaera phototrophica]